MLEGTDRNSLYNTPISFGWQNITLQQCSRYLLHSLPDAMPPAHIRSPIQEDEQLFDHSGMPINTAKYNVEWRWYYQ